MDTTTATMTTQGFRMTQVIMPRWMQEVVDAADDVGADVQVTRRSTPFGTFVVAVEVA